MHNSHTSRTTRQAQLARPPTKSSAMLAGPNGTRPRRGRREWSEWSERSDATTSRWRGLTASPHRRVDPPVQQRSPQPPPRARTLLSPRPHGGPVQLRQRQRQSAAQGSLPAQTQCGQAADGSRCRSRPQTLLSGRPTVCARRGGVHKRRLRGRNGRGCYAAVPRYVPTRPRPGASQALPRGHR